MALLSPLGNLFIAIQERITDEVPDIKWVDQNFGQLDQERPTVVFPCALIDLAGWLYEDQGNNIQTATGLVIITVADAPFSNTNAIAPTLYKEKALRFYEMEHLIGKALHGWTPTNFQKLKRRTLDKLETENTLRGRVLTFETGFTDESGKKTRTLFSPHAPRIGSDVLPNA